MSEKIIVTISRQYGSQGHDIGQMLAQKLNIDFYDNKIIAEASEDSDVTPETIQTFDEKAANSFLYSLVMGLQHKKLDPDEYDMPLPQKVFLAEYRAVRKIASETSAVFVGRCADYDLQDAVSCVRVFIYAPLEVRIKTVMKRENINGEQALKLIHKEDRRRSSYYNYYTEKKWGGPDSYDLCIDSSRCDISGAVDTIESYVKAVQKKQG